MTIALRGATLVDGTGTDPRRADVIVHGERIDSVGTAATADDTVDVSGLTLLPGLIDAHSHFGLVDLTASHMAPAVTAAHIFRNCQLALEAGFTTVRDTGGLDGGLASGQHALVTAHGRNGRGIRDGLEAGVGCYEHGTFVDEETAAAMAGAGAYLVPTFAVLRLFVEMAPAWGIPERVLPRMAGIEEA